MLDAVEDLQASRIVEVGVVVMRSEMNYKVFDLIFMHTFRVKNSLFVYAESL